MKSLKRTGGVILFVVLLAFTFFGCDGISNPGNMEEILGTLELNGKFVSQNGSIISFAANKTVTVKGWVVDEDGNWSSTEHTGNLKVENNKIVSDSIIVNDYAYKDGEAIERKSYCKLEITVNPEDVTTLLIKTTYKGIGDKDYEYDTTYVYIPVETTAPNFDGTWTFGDNKLILSNGKFAIVDDTQVLYSGNTWVWDEVKNNIFFNYDISDTDYEDFDGYLARSGKLHIRIYSSEKHENEYFVSTKLSDSVDVDFDFENPLIGKYKDFNGNTIEITDSSVTVNSELNRWNDDGTLYRIKNPSIDYTFSFMDINTEWLELGEKETTFEIVKWNDETDEYEVIGTETCSAIYEIHYQGEYVHFNIMFGDIIEEGNSWWYEHQLNISAVKYLTAPVDFTGTWVLTEKLYNDERYETAEITINSDGSYSLLVDGKEMNTENHLIDLEDANNENGCPAYDFRGVITESGKLYASFSFSVEEGWYSTSEGFFTKQ